jgi:hypothetical protein
MRLAGSSIDCNRLMVWDVALGVGAKLRLGLVPLHLLSWSPDGNYLFAGESVVARAAVRANALSSSPSRRRLALACKGLLYELDHVASVMLYIAYRHLALVAPACGPVCLG